MYAALLLQGLHANPSHIDASIHASVCRNVSFYLAAKETPHGKMLLKEDALAIFDGSIFPRLANVSECGAQLGSSHPPTLAQPTNTRATSLHFAW